MKKKLKLIKVIRALIFAANPMNGGKPPRDIIRIIIFILMGVDIMLLKVDEMEFMSKVLRKKVRAILIMA